MEKGEPEPPPRRLRVRPDSIEVSPKQILRWGRCGSGIAVLIVSALLFFGRDIDDSAVSEDSAANADHRPYLLWRRLSDSAAANGLALDRHLEDHDTSCDSEDGHGVHAIEMAVTGSKLPSMLSFLFSCFFVCSVLDHFNLCVPIAWRFPISVVMFIAGIGVGSFFLHVTKDERHIGNGFDNLIYGMRDAAHFDPHALLYIILPPLLYESASSMQWHALRKVLPSCVVLAVPGVFLNTFLTGCFVKVAIRIKGDPVNWASSMLLAAILSATDPVAVVSALAALGAPLKLSSLVEGESLLNDGSAVVAAYVFIDWVLEDAPSSEKNCPSVGGHCVVRFFLQVAIGGCLIGALVGIMLYLWMRLARSRHLVMLELGIVLIAVYGTFFVAESLRISGVLAVVMLGFIMSSGLTARLSHEGRHAHHIVLSQIAYCCNQVAFFGAGIISARFATAEHSCESMHTITNGLALLELLGLYIIIHVTRAAVIAAFWPFLTRFGYGITWKEGLILVYGGLRGAVGLVMGLIVEHNPYISPPVRQMIVFHTSGIVLLTLFINGSTVDGLYKKLQLYPPNPFRQTHLRKVLLKAEQECQKAGVKQIAQEWFFHDCDLKKILRCVPNFAHIEFDVAGMPQAIDIDTVKMALDGLEEDAQEYRQRKFLPRKSTGSGSSNGDRWAERKSACQEKLVGIIEAGSELPDMKDQIRSVNSSGDRHIEYRPPERGAAPGFYASARSLQAIATEEDNFFGFELMLVKLEGVQCIVGFLTQFQAAHDVAPSVDCQVLGSIDNSIGFNVTTNSIMYNGPSGHGEVDSLEDVVAKAGEVLCVRMSRSPGREWEVVFSLRRGAEQDEPTIELARWSFGPFTPGELYPAVEFRVSDCTTSSWSLFRQPRTGTDCAIQHSDGQPDLPGSIGGDASTVPTLVDTLATTAMKTVGTVMQASEVAARSGVLAATARANNTLVGRNGADSTELRRHHGGRKNIMDGQKQLCCKVALSYEPQLASDQESINELFHVLFNTVSHRYHDMHEHGILADAALGWLLEAVGEAMDCANSEVNAMHAFDFKNFQKMGDAYTPPESASSGTTLRKMRTQFNNVTSDDSQAKLAFLFEPVMVEYLTLEAAISSTSVWDRFPAKWERMRLLGYGKTRAKVEMLWAFVEAHEKVLSDSPTMGRFPILIECIRSVIDEARADLNLLAALQPRRFFYSKHVVALRVVMNRRVAKIEKFINDGWLSNSDGENLLHSLWDRILQVDQYIPRVHFGSATASRPARVEAANAWEDVDFLEQVGGESALLEASLFSDSHARQKVASDSAAAAAFPNCSTGVGAEKFIGINVTMVCARGLMREKPVEQQPTGQSPRRDVQCVCAIPGKPISKFKTQVVVIADDEMSPSVDVKHHRLQVCGYVVGDSLEFTVMGPLPDEVLGDATLEGGQFYPCGFEGELPLTSDACRGKAHLTVKVVVTHGAVSCPKCGNLFMSDSHFCRKCGNARPQSHLPSSVSPTLVTERPLSTCDEAAADDCEVRTWLTSASPADSEAHVDSEEAIAGETPCSTGPPSAYSRSMTEPNC